MPPYLVNAAPTIDAGWLTNPDPDIYSSWEEFAKQLFWDWQLGEAFVISTARYATGWPARFHVLPPWSVNIEIDAGRRTYKVGEVDVTGDLLHLRYQSSVGDAHGHGPLEAGQAVLVAASVLGRYASSLTATIPPSLLEAPEEMSPDQAELLRDDWVSQRIANPGVPAVLSGGLKWTPTQLNPRDMALLELSQFTDGKIAVLLGVPPFLVGLPAGGNSMTYSNVTSLFDYHWRSGLRPSATTVMAGLSEWLLPRGTTVEVNKDAYVQPEPLTRAQTEQILVGMGAMSVEEVRAAERLDDQTDTVIAGPVTP
jgi:HK97 family phage portal protein